jgi:hypothetical protein
MYGFNVDKVYALREELRHTLLGETFPVRLCSLTFPLLLLHSITNVVSCTALVNGKISGFQ